MPQMGESITEGTVSKWLKAVGDDDRRRTRPLLEISTDKVDAEVPSPAAGTLLAINVQEGETVEVGSVLGACRSGRSRQQSAVSSQAQVSEKPCQNRPPIAAGSSRSQSATAGPPKAAVSNGGNGNATVDELRRQKSSPLVRNIAKEHGIDITRIPGSGISGRVTKNDIMSFIETGAALRPQDLLVKGCIAPMPRPKPKTEDRHSSLRRQRRHHDRGPRRENVGDAKEDRRAHDVLEADLGTRDERLRDRHDERRKVPQGESGRRSRRNTARS